MNSAKAKLQLPAGIYDELWRHLLRKLGGDEEAAFVFVERDTTDSTLFRYVEWFPVPPDGFARQSPFHFELTDQTRATVIKRAHDLSATLVEFHSHTSLWEAKFSASDWSGFEEVVPHMWWRLKGRPYGAVVVSRTGFDAFIWLANPNTPTRLDGIVVEDKVLKPSHLSPLERHGYDWTV